MAKRNSSYAWMHPVALIGIAAPVLSLGIVRAMRGDWILLAVGAAIVALVLVTWAIVKALDGMRESTDAALDQLNALLKERAQEFSLTLNQVSEQQLISDRGKAVAFRAKDRDALRRAIQEEMTNKDWEAALALADDMERVFGYKHEADRLREDIESRRNETLRRQINEAAANVERHCRGEDWESALREAERIAATWPNDAAARDLPQQVKNRRQQEKRQLLESLREAQERNDYDGGWEIIKRLDLYLTPSEAATIQEDARNILRGKLHQLGEQFKAAVHEQRNADVTRIGEQIMQQFPNSRMAQEVREMLPALQQRSAEPAAAE